MTDAIEYLYCIILKCGHYVFWGICQQKSSFKDFIQYKLFCDEMLQQFNNILTGLHNFKVM